MKTPSWPLQIRKNSIPLRNEETYSPIFIVGSGRSGNTLLRRILCSNTGIYIPPETYVLGPSISAFNKISGLEWRFVCQFILSMFMFSEDFEQFPTQDLRPLYKSLLETPHRDRSYSCIIDQFYSFMAKHADPASQIWGDKTPLNAFHLDKIRSVFPHAKFIHIIRDGFDVISSYLEMGRYGNIEDAAERWLESIDLCQKFGRRHPNQYMEIFYENLVREPDVATKSVCLFLNISYKPEMISSTSVEHLGDIGARDHYGNVSRPISTNSIGKGK